jgi:aspartyl-tRNA(Asn)/glutamyl-tRNA(Gln) amidotransferase subunit A
MLARRPRRRRRRRRACALSPQQHERRAPPGPPWPPCRRRRRRLTLIAGDLDHAYADVDVLVSPATPTTAVRLGEKVDDPLAMYLFDLCTLPLNLAGHCGMSVPAGLSPDDNLPVGLQIMAPALADDRLYRVGAAYEVARGPLPAAL